MRRSSGALVVVIALAVCPGNAHADGRSSTLIAYGDNGSNVAQSRTWNGAEWRSETTTPDLGSKAEWVVTADCPTRDETALATVDGGKDLNLVFYDGSSWGSTTELSADVEVNTERPYYLAYEQSSGDLLVAYWVNGDDKLAYRTWDGTTLSSESLFTLPTNEKLHFATLTPKPDSDEIMLVMSNDDKDIVAVRWSGSAWGTASTLETDCGYTTEEPFSFVYEGLSGTGLLAYGEKDKNEPRYRTWNGTTWSGELLAPTVNKKQRYIRLVADPASDEVIMGSLDDDKDLNLLVWSGSAWGSALEIEADMQERSARHFDVAYERGDGGEALVVYAENGVQTPRYRTWNGTAWGAEQSGPDLGDKLGVVQARTGEHPGEVFIAIIDEGNDLNFMRWDGTAMSTNTQLHSSLSGDSENEPFMLTVAPVANLLEVVVNPSSLTSEELARKRHFSYWGYQVNLIDESDAQGIFDTAVGVNHVAYVPEECSSGNLGTKLLAAPIGVVVEESDCYDAFGLTATNAGAETGSAVTITAYDHYITEPYSSGSLTICSSAQPMNKVTQAVASGGQVLADWSGGGNALIALEGHGRLIDSTRASGRRVFLPVGDNTFAWSALNTDGLTIVRRSIEWSHGARAYWKLDETAGTTAADELGDFDATLTSMDPGTDWTEGRTGGGLDFDGVNDRAPSTATFRPPVEGTVAFWMRIPGTPATQGRIIGIDDAWEIRHETDGGLVFDLGVTSGTHPFESTATLTQANRWYHVVATYSQIDSTYAIYLDGTLDKSGSQALDVPDGDLITLATRTGSTDYFVGVLDDVRILDHVVDADEVAALRSTGMPRIVSWLETNPD